MHSVKFEKGEEIKLENLKGEHPTPARNLYELFQCLLLVQRWVNSVLLMQLCFEVTNCELGTV